jgi:hypothetical protein
MIKEYVDKWNKNKNKLKEYFRNTRQEEYDRYYKIVEKLIEIIINDDEEEYKRLDIEKIKQIDDGSYQGTEIYIIPRETYQPSIDDYVYTYAYYGSCSGCDTLLGISHYEEDKPSEKQVEGYMQLALHLLQHFHYLKDKGDDIE